MFSSLQLWLLLLAATVYTASIYFFSKNRNTLFLLFLFATALFTFSFSALLCDFINIWDERFHALVAKNLIDNPLKPTLYIDPVLPRDYSGWYNAHVWLHKQPLFLWQMALSMKLFGANIFAFRLPGIILSSLVVVASFDAGRILANRWVGFWASFFMLTSFYWMGLVSGYVQLDQNDVAFMSYVSLSIWAFIAYTKNQKLRFGVLVGIFVGFAILCKWLAGSFVLAIWALYILLNGNKINRKRILDWMLALGIAVAVALPWQLYCHFTYPELYAQEMQYNALHLWEAVEGHGGNWRYYYDLIRQHYGLGQSWILIVTLLFFVSYKFNKLKLALATGFIAQFAFFTAAATKMPSFTMVGWMPALLSMGFVAGSFFQRLEGQLNKSYFASLGAALAILALIPLRLKADDFLKIFEPKSENLTYQEAMRHNQRLFKTLQLPKNAVLFNVNGIHYVEAMFYTGVPVYGGLPTQEELTILKTKRYKAIILVGSTALPDYLNHNNQVTFIKGFNYTFE